MEEVGAITGRRGGRTIGLLTLLAVVQILVLVVAQGGPASASPSVDAGYDFGGVELLDGDSEATRLDRGERTLVLAFHSTCAHCEALAPTWRAWLEHAPPGLTVLAVSREPHPSALAYAERHDWKVAVRSAVVPVVGVRARALVRLTPWVYALDEDGRVVAAGHGSEIDRIAEALQEPAS